MTRKQSFAIYCKTGCDVRGVDLNNIQIDFILSNYWIIGREALKVMPGVKVKKIPEHKGDWKYKEYDLLFEYAMKQAIKAYSEHETMNDKVGVAVVVMSNGRKGFVKYYGKKIKIAIGKSLKGNLAGASEFCKILYNLGDIKEISCETM